MHELGEHLRNCFLKSVAARERLSWYLVVDAGWMVAGRWVDFLSYYSVESAEFKDIIRVMMTYLNFTLHYY